MSSKKRIRSHDSTSSNWSNGSVDKDSKINDKYNNERINNAINSEHELFLQAFESIYPFFYSSIHLLIISFRTDTNISILKNSTFGFSQYFYLLLNYKF